jgi:hypothetical protein
MTRSFAELIEVTGSVMPSSTLPLCHSATGSIGRDLLPNHYLFERGG